VSAPGNSCIGFSTPLPWCNVLLAASLKKDTDTNRSGTSLSLQSLIDLRHEIIRKRDSGQTGRTGFPGQRMGIRRGQGMEFIDLRQYNEADDVRHIDWNVTARSTEPYTRLYREEREHICTVVADLRPVMFNGSDCLRAVAAGRLASLLLWQSCHSGDRTSAIVLYTSGIKSTRPASGKKGVLQSLELIVNCFDETKHAVKANRLDSQTPPQLPEALQLVNSKATGICFSGFDDSAVPDFHITGKSASGQLRAVLLLDRLEQQVLPAGKYNYTQRGTANSGVKSVQINRSNAKLLAKSLAADVRARQQTLNAAGVPMITVSTTTPPADFLPLVHHWV